MKLSPEMLARVLSMSGADLVREPAPKAKRKPVAVAPATALAAAARIVLTVAVPLRLESVANKREHWAVRKKRVAAERDAVKMASLASSFTTAALQGLTFQFERDPGFRVTVTLTRVGARLWDGDNNVSGLKAVRDAVANWWLLINDGDPRVSWACEQRVGPPGVEIRIEGAA